MAADQGLARGDRAPDAGRLPRRGGDQPVGHRARPLHHRHAVRDPRRAAARCGPGRRAHRCVFLLPPRRCRGLRGPQAKARPAAPGGPPLQRLARRPPYGGRLAEGRAGGRCRGRATGAGAHRQGREDAGRGQSSAGHAGLSGSRRIRRASGSMTWLRSTLFAAALVLITPPYALVALATFPLPRMARYRIISGWSRLAIWLAKIVLGIDWRIEGREHLPARPAVILSKHQSAWETLAFQLIFPPQVHVLKRELLWIPFFGWGLALMSPIAIDRSRGVAALRAISRRGRERHRQGFRSE